MLANRVSKITAHSRSQPRFRTRVCAVTPGDKLAVKDPFADKTLYKDSMADLAMIKLYTGKMASQIPGVRVPLIARYEDFVRVSKELMKGRSPIEQRLLVRNVLFSIMPTSLPATFRTMFPPSKMSAEINARMATLGFGWLVGNTELRQDVIKVSPTESRVQNSVVLIKKCRYLEASGCVGLCTNLCKMPTQSFFTDDCGLPLTMVPNWEDLSCEMRFGEPPPPMEEDEAFTQPCFKMQCSTSINNDLIPCPKMSSTG
eukprot:gene14191-20160_t